VIKVELHSHSADDPADYIPHSTCQLIDRAAELGYHALAITLHDRQLDLRPYADHARQLGVTLIPGIERTIHGKHVLLLNFSRAGAEAVQTFDDLARLRTRERGLVVAPHPYFPAGICLGRFLDSYADLFDAIEYNAMFTVSLNFNERAVRWARKHRKPLVGNGDVHRLAQLGTTYSLVDAANTADAICEAIRRHRVQVVASPLPVLKAAGVIASIFAGNLRAGAAHPHPDEREYSAG
jgi:predicted metal-dependent phosphoesterase TrpH